MNETSPDVWRFLAHFHPVLVHLPIGAVLIVVVLEGLALRPVWRGVAGSVPAILAVSAPASLAAAGCGWLLAEGGGYEPGLLAWHRWTGVAAALLMTVLVPLQRGGWTGLYRAVLVLTVGVVSLAGHHGGSLTHGRDYLTRHAPEPLRSLLGGAPKAGPKTGGASPAAEAPTLYEAAVQPILDRHCTSCHGREKSKGGLRVDSIEAVMKGGDSGPAVVAGKPGESSLVTRIRLPLDHDDHMPPEGKSQPTAEELRVLEWWIGAGAAVSGRLDDSGVPAEIRDRVRAGGR